MRGWLAMWKMRRILRQVRNGRLTMNEARAKLGLPPWIMSG